MIIYDYEIKRFNKSGEFEVFKPEKIPRELDNIVYIEGPNSSGKSTLLNLIALGLHGLEGLKKGFAFASIYDLPQLKILKFPLSLSGVFEK